MKPAAKIDTGLITAITIHRAHPARPIIAQFRSACRGGHESKLGGVSSERRPVRWGVSSGYELGMAGGLVVAPGGAPKKRWKPCWSWVTSMIRMTVVVLPLTVAVTTTRLPALMEPMPSR